MFYVVTIARIQKLILIPQVVRLSQPQKLEASPCEILLTGRPCWRGMLDRRSMSSTDLSPFTESARRSGDKRTYVHGDSKDTRGLIMNDDIMRSTRMMNQ